MEIYKFIIILAAAFTVARAVDQEEVAETNISLTCRLPNIIFPTWKGPPGSVVLVQEGEETNANYTWVSYGEDNKTLMIFDALPRYSGDYTCEKGGNAAETISLNILAKPVVSFENKTDVVFGNFLRSQVITGLEDKNIDVVCIATGANPQPSIDIIPPVNITLENIVTPATSNTDKTFTAKMSGTILAERGLDMTQVICKSTNPTPPNKLGEYTEQDSAMIYLKLKPKVFSMQGPGPIDVGKNATFSCDAERGRPAPTISWLFDDQPINMSRFIIESTLEEPVQESETITVFQNITLVEVTRDDNKKALSCVVEHDTFDEPHRDKFVVKVNFGPDYVNITGNDRIFATEDASLKLTCSTATMGTVAENPEYTIIRWRNETNNAIIENKAALVLTDGENNGTKVSQDLTINVTRYMNGQRITCFVGQQDNFLKEVTATVSLDIDYSPVITYPEDNIVRFAVHDNAALKCSARSKPPSNFTWYEVGNNDPLAEGPGTNERNEFYLQWNDIGYNDSGKYKCVATNKEGYKDEREVEVLITESPQLPSSFAILSSDSETMTVSFTPPSATPDIYQSYYLQYRGASGGTSAPWHEVLLPDGADYKLTDLKHDTEYQIRIKVRNKYGSERYTETQSMKTTGMELEDGYRRKDVDIAIAVSVVVTAVVIVTLVLIIYAIRRKRVCGSSSEKFELQTR